MIKCARIPRKRKTKLNEPVKDKKKSKIIIYFINGLVVKKKKKLFLFLPTDWRLRSHKSIHCL